jgi:hypothetical protein
MRVMMRLTVAVLPLLLVIGCDNGKPKPAELPKELMPTPKTRPIPGGGGGSKAPPQTGQVPSRGIV